MRRCPWMHVGAGCFAGHRTPGTERFFRSGPVSSPIISNIPHFVGHLFQSETVDGFV